MILSSGRLAGTKIPIKKKEEVKPNYPINDRLQSYLFELEEAWEDGLKFDTVKNLLLEILSEERKETSYNPFLSVVKETEKQETQEIQEEKIQEIEEIEEIEEETKQPKIEEIQEETEPKIEEIIDKITEEPKPETKRIFRKITGTS